LSPPANFRDPSGLRNHETATTFLKCSTKEIERCFKADGGDDFDGPRKQVPLFLIQPNRKELIQITQRARG